MKKETIDCKEETEHRRFAVSVSESDIQQLISSQTNPNTCKNTKWSTDTFNKWRESRKNVPYLKEMNADSLSYWLQRFVLEVRKLDGSEYPPRTLYYIVCGLLRHLRDENIHNMNFLDENDHRFAVFRKVLDARMKELLSKGLGTKVRQADPISPKDEEKIWDERVFGSHSSQALQYTVFFYNCKVFGLRAFDEHRNLECAQFEIGQDGHGQFIRFTGRSSKTFKGGLQHLQLTNKDIKHYCDEGQRCLVDYYRIYLDALGNEGPFYRRPLAGSGSVSVRYGEQVLGINKLKGLMKEITDRPQSMALKIEGSQEVLYKQKLLSSFNLLYAYEILNKLQDVIIEQGNGCVINHPSQSQHTCIMRSDVDNLELLFELAWENVKADNVIAKWEDEIQTLNIPQYFKDSCSQCLHCIAWRKSYAEKIANLRTQYELVEKMIKLEERFLF
ncbi:hypothetical protein FSP39_009112 [Pinctada imbricata]|uniref:DUF3504 domain-containing protein n=1 Tax=Pinctada imbricata TaxID=66713 RepID=A0AA88YVR2_PINIB|nr:hypothetical protein FSP39_009112 [Pinctada imbricata]